jgi:hypothetical protein
LMKVELKKVENVLLVKLFNKLIFYFFHYLFIKSIRLARSTWL